MFTLITRIVGSDFSLERHWHEIAMLCEAMKFSASRNIAVIQFRNMASALKAPGHVIKKPKIAVVCPEGEEQAEKRAVRNSITIQLQSLGKRDDNNNQNLSAS